jgi:hypothetical protein
MADPKLIAILSSLLGSLPGVKEKQLPNHTSFFTGKTSSSSPAAPAIASSSNFQKKESPGF